MGNIFSFFHFLECKKRPNSLLGKKKPLIIPIVQPIYNMYPVYTAPLVGANEGILENTAEIQYNTSPPYLISTVVSPLTEYHETTVKAIDKSDTNFNNTYEV